MSRSRYIIVDSLKLVVETKLTMEDIGDELVSMEKSLNELNYIHMGEDGYLDNNNIIHLGQLYNAQQLVNDFSMFENIDNFFIGWLESKQIDYMLANEEEYNKLNKCKDYIHINRI